MINILFVDDEPHLLTALQRLLRPMRHEWEMAFVSSGAAALELLAQRKMDVLVSDMRMPGMDGAELLQQASEQHPYLVRIILSGFAEKEALLRTINVAHQYLAKPCDTEILKLIVNHTYALRQAAGDEAPRQVVAQLRRVPSLPTLYQQVLEELENPHPSLKKLGAIIEQDPGMTAKVLQIVNSALFSLRQTVASAQSAVSLLGIDTISALALGLGVFAQLGAEQSQPLLEQGWERSLKVAELAQWIAAHEAPDCATPAFTAGLLHDIGRVVLAVNLPQEYVAVQALQEREQIALPLAETRIYGASGAAVGAYLLGLWGLPQSIVEAVGQQDAPPRQAAFTPLTAVYLARGLVNHADRDILAAPEQYFDREYLQRLQMWEKLPAWYAACHQQDRRAS
jgi:HD-like signal output (HDOD) protein